MKLRFFSLLLLLALLLSSCGTQTHMAVFYNKMSTDVAVTLYSNGQTHTGKELLRACEELLDQAETVFSRTAPTAELAMLNAEGAETVAVSPELGALLARSLSLAEETGGLFDPTAGILSDLYDITGTSPLPTAGEIAAALPLTGYTGVALADGKVSRTPGVVLDLGAIAKGYLAEQLVCLLTEAGVSGGVLSLGGNVAVFGKKKDGSAFRVAIRSPHDEGGTLGVLSISGTAYISTSGAYERYREDEEGNRYHHIFDMQTGRPAESDLLSVTVISQDGALADAYSTALFVGGYERALQLWQQAGGTFEMLLVREGGEIYTTPGLSFTPV
ncbi:MAG: FAD:protein FMN transferase [Clostridia bacterium]|nr:FAD:protein FMN transferase [Clostridia bacterium]